MIYTFFIGICILGFVLVYDADLRIRSIFFRKTLQKRAHYVSKEVPRMFFAMAKTWFGFSIEYEIAAKTELPRQFLIVSNHQSLIDIPILFYYFNENNVRFVSKKELGRWVPLISQVLRIQRHCLVDRKANRMQSMKNIDSFSLEAHREGWSPAIFPEGTRTRTGAVGTFHTGGVRKMLELAPMPVVSVALDGGWQLRGLTDLISRIRGGTYRVKILSVYPAPTSRAEASTVLDSAYTEIKEQVFAWNGQS